MEKTPQETARDRVIDLAADARYRPFVVGYLLGCLDERHWDALVAAAIEFAEGVDRRHAELSARYGEVRQERG